MQAWVYSLYHYCNAQRGIRKGIVSFYGNMFLPSTEISVIDFNINSIAKHLSLTAFHIGLYIDVFTYNAGLGLLDVVRQIRTYI